LQFNIALLFDAFLFAIIQAIKILYKVIRMLGDNLRIMRKYRNLTQNDMAAHLKIQRQTYSTYERGISIPDALTLKKISGVLQCSADHLLADADVFNRYIKRRKLIDECGTNNLLTNDEIIETLLAIAKSLDMHSK
jgi:transcriptional regulator with XRE-family HTH domain